MTAISPQTALIYVMVTVSAADGNMADSEIEAIAARVRDLPVFGKFERAHLLRTAQECAAILAEADGLDAVLGLAAVALSEPLKETAYLLALDVALSDHRVRLEEVRILDRLRQALGLDRLITAALERAARARRYTA
ncbi:MAG: tellurite resistance TerB family protein [Alphaproteobacteria bacterium]|nr:tellurite resistance TerB family protein [Alphaproteobacteria bacterium]